MALASRAHQFSKRFGTKCLSEPQLCTEGNLAEPAGIAADETTHNLYVGDRAAGRVVEFDAEGTYLGELTGPNGEGSGNLTEGSATVEAAVATKGAFTVGEEVSAPGVPVGTKIAAIPVAGTLELSNPVEAGKSGVGVELKAQQRFERPESLAVDNFCPLAEAKPSKAECEAQDPSSEDLYVADTGTERRAIDKFSPAGEFLGQITHAGATSFAGRALDGVAVDPLGVVWVYREEPAQVDGFTNEAQNEFIMPEISLNEGVAHRASFAIDSHGNFYGTAEVKGAVVIPKWEHSGTLLSEALDGEGSTAVATEQIGDAALVDSGTGIDVFGPDEKLIERLGEEDGEKHLGQSGPSAGVGADVTAGSVYASDTAAGEVVLFGPAQPTVPKIESQSVSNIGAGHATLAAQINPQSEAGEAETTYRFQYGPCTTPATCPQSGYEAETPAGQLPPDFEVHAVSAKLEGLEAATTYHFRAIASNSHGEGAPGEETLFATEGAGGPLPLPDDRGWELVSPPDKQGAQIAPISESGVVQAAASGEGITYLADLPTEPNPQGYSNAVQILSRRGASSWSSRDIAIPHAGTTGFALGPGPEYKFFNPELTNSAVQPFGPFNPGLSEEASESTAYLHDLGEGCASHCFHPLVTGKPGFANVPTGTVFGEEELCEARPEQSVSVVCGPEFAGASSDLSHVVLATGAALVPGPRAGGLYEWSAASDTLSRVSVLPDGTPETGAGLGLSSQSTRGAIAASGTRIAWSGKENLYERDTTLGADGETVQLDAGEGCGGCQSGGGRFQLQSADGTRVLFTDEKPLTEDSGAAAHKADLYECRIGVVAGKLACALTDLTPAHAGEAAEVQSVGAGGGGKGTILGGSEDASSAYFVANGVLSDAANARGQKAQHGKENLYVRREGSVRFIAVLAEGDEHDWSEELFEQPTRVSPNGRFLELMSEAPLTGYENRDRETGEATAEVYIYDADSGRLSCASCDPSGEQPVGVEYHKLEPGSGGLVGGGRRTWNPEGLVAANVPGWTTIHSGPSEARYQPNYLNNQGRLFFNSINALVPQDSNANQDVYEYEPPGIGSCATTDPTYSAQSAGCVSLISSGRSTQESAFMDASQSGNDVFFLSTAQLSKLDVDSSRDIYDAHVCTDSPCITFPSSEVPPCTSEASCKASPTPQPSIFGSPSSATFQGPGNPAPAPPAAPKVKSAEEIRLERLSKALKACRAKKNKHKRQVCEKQARAKYAKAKPKKKPAKKKAKAKGGHK
jgi:hypothetical protein